MKERRIRVYFLLQTVNISSKILVRRIYSSDHKLDSGQCREFDEMLTASKDNLKTNVLARITDIEDFKSF